MKTESLKQKIVSNLKLTSGLNKLKNGQFISKFLLITSKAVLPEFKDFD